MGVRTLVGTADGTDHGAAMYDSSTGWMIGPLWQTPDASEQIDVFLAWMDGLPFVALAYEIGLEPRDLPHPAMPSTDVRFWPDSGLAKLISYWCSTHLGEDGCLRA